MRYVIDKSRDVSEWNEEIEDIIGDKLKSVSISDGELVAIQTTEELSSDERAEIVSLIGDRAPITPNDLVPDDNS